MSTEENKRVIAGYFEAFNRQDREAMLSLIDDKYTFRSMTRFPEWLLRPWNKWQFASAGFVQSSLMKKPIRVTVVGMTAEGNKLAVELTSYGEMKNGKIYDNAYHFLFELRDGKIIDAKEYCCSALAADVFGEYEAEFAREFDKYKNGPVAGG
jgi:ketosteroid isomerase-like protein